MAWRRVSGGSIAERQPTARSPAVEMTSVRYFLQQRRGEDDLAMLMP